jgi:hypothetical protein
VKSNFKYIIISFPFLLIMFLLFVNQSVGLIKDGKNVENKAKIKKPKIDATNFEEFPGLYDKYFQDNFNLRSSFISFYNYLNKDVFYNSILSKKFLRGKDDFLFQLYMFNKEKTYFADAHKVLIKKELERRDSIYNSYGTKMFVFFIPCKGNFYKKKLPPFFSDIETNRSEDLVKYLQDNSKVSIYSLKDYLKSKDTTDLYLKYDTHWNRLGAFFGYEYITSKIAEFFPTIEVVSMKDYNVSTTVRSNGDLAKNLGLKLLDEQYVFKPTFKKRHYIDTFPQKYPAKDFVKYGNKAIGSYNKNLPKAIVIHDSFAVLMKKFFFNSFGKTYYLWDKWKYKPHYDIVKGFDADIVVFILLENSADKFLPDKLRRRYNVFD